MDFILKCQEKVNDYFIEIQKDHGTSSPSGNWKPQAL